MSTRFKIEMTSIPKSQIQENIPSKISSQWGFKIFTDLKFSKFINEAFHQKYINFFLKIIGTLCEIKIINYLKTFKQISLLIQNYLNYLTKL